MICRDGEALALFPEIPQASKELTNEEQRGTMLQGNSEFFSTTNAVLEAKAPHELAPLVAIYEIAHIPGTNTAAPSNHPAEP